MGLFVNQDGVWTEVKELHTHHGGNWVQVKEAFVNDGGVWKKYLSSIEPIIAIIPVDLSYTAVGELINVIVVGGGGGGGASGSDSYGNSTGSGGGGGGQIVVVGDYVPSGDLVITAGAGGQGGTSEASPGENGMETRVEAPGLDETAYGGAGGQGAYNTVPGDGGTVYAKGGNGGDGGSVDGQPGESTAYAAGGQPDTASSTNGNGGGGGAGYGYGGKGDGSDGYIGGGGGGNTGYHYDIKSGGNGADGAVVIISKVYDPSQPHHLFPHPYMDLEIRNLWLTPDGLNTRNTAPVTASDESIYLGGTFEPDPTGRFENIMYRSSSHSFPAEKITGRAYSLWINFEELPAGSNLQFMTGSNAYLSYEVDTGDYIAYVYAGSIYYLRFHHQEIGGEWAMITISYDVTDVYFWRNNILVGQESYNSEGGNPVLNRVNPTNGMKVGPFRTFSKPIYQDTVDALYTLGE